MKIEQQPQLPKTLRPIVCIGGGGIMRDAHLPAYRKIRFSGRSIGKMRHLFGPLVNAPNTPKGHRVSLLMIVCRSLGRARSTVWLSVGPYRVQSGTR